MSVRRQTIPQHFISHSAAFALDSLGAQEIPMDEAPLTKPTPTATGASASTSAPAKPPTQVRIGTVSAVSGFKLSCVLFDAASPAANAAAYERAQIGALVKVATPSTVAFGFIDSLADRKSVV